jgi:hypothetical protein
MRVLGRVATAVRLLGMAIAFVIAVGIAVSVLDAKEQGVMAGFLDVCRFLVDPFRGLVDLRDGREELQLGVNWGIGAVTYLLAGLLLGALVARLGRR